MCPITTRRPTSHRELARQLPRLVSCNLDASAAVIDDACQVAWARFLSRREELQSGTELGWLVTVATRVGLRQLERGTRDLSYEQERDTLANRIDSGAGPERLAELHERLREVDRLPRRQQRALLMHGYGYRYEEIAALTGDSRRTVERQLARAREKLAA